MVLAMSAAEPNLERKGSVMSMRESVVMDSFRLTKKGDTSVDALAQVADIVAMGTRCAASTSIREPQALKVARH